MTSTRSLRSTGFGAAALVILAFLLVPPLAPLDKADRAAYAVCHRIPERSFIFGGRPLPLCARCSGTYLGAAGALAGRLLTGKGRAGRFPARRWWPALGILVAAWAIDGFNSFLTLFPGAPHAYEPRNLLRLATGAGLGVVLATILLPALNQSLWKVTAPGRSLGEARDWLAPLAGAVLLAVPAATEWAPLLHPLALLSGLTILAMLGAVNAVFVLIVLRREGQGLVARDALLPFAAGVALACVQLTLIAVARDALTRYAGLAL